MPEVKMVLSGIELRAWRRQIDHDLSAAADQLNDVAQRNEIDLEAATDAHREVGRALDELWHLYKPISDGDDATVVVDESVAVERFERAIDYAMTDADHSSVGRDELRERLRIAEWALNRLDELRGDEAEAA